MNTSMTIQSRGESYEALATAAVKALLKFLTSQSINTLLALCAFISLMCWLISDGHAGDPAPWCIAWVLHFALMSALDIKKGGVK